MVTCYDCAHYDRCTLKDERVSLAIKVKELIADGFNCFKSSAEAENAVKLDLKFDETNLAGEEYGFETYIKQIKEKWKYNQKVILYFPDKVKCISSSFIQGMFKEILGALGIDGVENSFDIVSSSIPNIKEYVMKKLRY